MKKIFVAALPVTARFNLTTTHFTLGHYTHRVTLR